MRSSVSTMLLALVGLALAGCAPELPRSAGGMDDPFAQQGSGAALDQTNGTVTGQPLVPAGVLSDEDVTSTTAQTGLTTAVPVVAAPLPVGADDIAAQTAAALAATGSTAAIASGGTTSATGLSDENDFAAVAQRQTIQSDAERIAQNRAQYEVIAPEALPARPGETQPNIVNYALQSSHARGTRLYSRSGINLESRAKRNCAAYPSPDQAQIEFLSKGGPERDRMALDPDGDGYACGWDPAPFRRAVQN